MERKEWKFDYTASKLAEAAKIKLHHHQERLEWWKEKKEQVITQIRGEGLEID